MHWILLLLFMQKKGELIKRNYNWMGPFRSNHAPYSRLSLSSLLSVFFYLSHMMSMNYKYLWVIAWCSFSKQLRNNHFHYIQAKLKCWLKIINNKITYLSFFFSWRKHIFYCNYIKDKLLLDTLKMEFHPSTLSNPSQIGHA